MKFITSILIIALLFSIILSSIVTVMSAKPILIKKPKIITREEWGAKLLKCEYEEIHT